MKMFVKFLVCVLCLLMPFFADALDEYNIGYGQVYSSNITVSDDSANVINHGEISGNIILENNRALKIQNYGAISGDFICDGLCSNVTQYVSGIVDEYGQTDVQILPGFTGHTIDAYNGNAAGVVINVADLIAIGQNAENIYIGNGTFAIGPGIDDFSHQILVKDEQVYFLITDIPDDISMPLISNVVMNGNQVHTDFSDDIDPMFNPDYDWRDNSLYIMLTRETNYHVVFCGALGDYLDGLRDKNPNDKLLSALDAQMNRDSMRRVLSRAGRTNPINLMRPIVTLNTHDSMLFLPGTAIAPFYMFANDFDVIGGHVNIGGDIGDNLYGNIGLVGGVMNYSSDYDDVSGILYGGNLGVQYVDDEYYINTYGAFSYVSFGDTDVFYHDKIFHNPGGIGINFVSDFGLVYKVYEDMNLNVIPFIGLRGDYISIVHQSDTDLNLRIGAKAEKTDNTDGNKYTIGGKLFAQTDGTIYGAFYVDMLSVADGVGGGLEVGAVYDDFGMSYKFALGGKIIF